MHNILLITFQQGQQGQFRLGFEGTKIDKIQT
jgi:hypothetical protein